MPFENWLRENSTAGKPLIPASTVIPIRNRGNGIEVLLMRRNSKVSFAEGMWVFPGGKVDPIDSEMGTPSCDINNREICF